MARLFYGGESEPVDMPDRVLAHVKVVAATKLRRGESFTISWRHPDGEPEGRSTLWLHPSIPLRFVFDSPEPELLDSDLLRRMAEAAGSSAGLTVDLTDTLERESPALRAVAG